MFRKLPQLLYNVLTMRLPEIIGISGTHGAGKDALAALRHERENALHVTLSDILREELAKEGVPLERANLMALSKRWREETGDHAILVVKTVGRYLVEKSVEGYGGLSIVSIRHPEEARRVKDLGGVILWVDADPRLRYERICSANRGRIDDAKTFEEFLEEENRELLPPQETSAASVNLGAVYELADEVVLNNFGSCEEYLVYLAEKYGFA